MQKETADTFWRGKAIKKAYLSIKYFVKFSLKRNHQHKVVMAHIKRKLLAKALVGLKQNIGLQAEKKDKIRIAFSIYDQNCQKRAFRQLRIICMERVVDRINRQKARDFLMAKLLRVSWNHWRIYRIESERERLNVKLAMEFRVQVLMRALFNNLQIASKIFKDVYSAERVGGIIQLSRTRALFKQLKLNRDMKVAIINQLPRETTFYYYSHVWATDYRLSRYS